MKKGFIKYTKQIQITFPNQSLGIHKKTQNVDLTAVCVFSYIHCLCVVLCKWLKQLMQQLLDLWACSSICIKSCISLNVVNSHLSDGIPLSKGAEITHLKQHALGYNGELERHLYQLSVIFKKRGKVVFAKYR